MKARRGTLRHWVRVTLNHIPFIIYIRSLFDGQG